MTDQRTKQGFHKVRYLCGVTGEECIKDKWGLIFTCKQGECMWDHRTTGWWMKTIKEMNCKTLGKRGSQREILERRAESVNFHSQSKCSLLKKNLRVSKHLRKFKKRALFISKIPLYQREKVHVYKMPYMIFLLTIYK